MVSSINHDTHPSSGRDRNTAVVSPIASVHTPHTHTHTNTHAYTHIHIDNHTQPQKGFKKASD